MLSRPTEHLPYGHEVSICPVLGNHTLFLDPMDGMVQALHIRLIGTSLTSLAHFADANDDLLCSCVTNVCLVAYMSVICTGL